MGSQTHTWEWGCGDGTPRPPDGKGNATLRLPDPWIGVRDAILEPMCGNGVLGMRPIDGNGDTVLGPPPPHLGPCPRCPATRVCVPWGDVGLGVAGHERFGGGADAAHPVGSGLGLARPPQHRGEAVGRDEHPQAALHPPREEERPQLLWRSARRLLLCRGWVTPKRGFGGAGLGVPCNPKAVPWFCGLPGPFQPNPNPLRGSAVFEDLSNPTQTHSGVQWSLKTFPTQPKPILGFCGL